MKRNRQHRPDEIDWDEAKNEYNKTTHDISFEEAQSVFNDPLAKTVDDPEHSYDEHAISQLDIQLKARC